MNLALYSSSSLRFYDRLHLLVYCRHLLYGFWTINNKYPLRENTNVIYNTNKINPHPTPGACVEGTFIDRFPCNASAVQSRSPALTTMPIFSDLFFVRAVQFITNASGSYYTQRYFWGHGKVLWNRINAQCVNCPYVARCILGYFGTRRGLLQGGNGSQFGACLETQH